ncbi:6650_t:CDS:2, partial [Scutellospora calospora]
SSFKQRLRNLLGYERAIIRGYFEAYDHIPGGAIDSHLLINYMNAKEAGYSYIDIYMTPCTGSSTCKTPQQQVDELVQFINTNQLIVQTFWLDLYVNPDSGNWNLGPIKNRQIITNFCAAWKSTDLLFGIFTSKRQWGMITGDENWVLDPNIPLWYAIYDSHPVLDDNELFGGWTQGMGKQYAGESKFCGGKFGENIFR